MFSLWYSQQTFIEPHLCRLMSLLHSRTPNTIVSASSTFHLANFTFGDRHQLHRHVRLNLIHTGDHKSDFSFGKRHRSSGDWFSEVIWFFVKGITLHASSTGCTSTVSLGMQRLQNQYLPSRSFHCCQVMPRKNSCMHSEFLPDLLPSYKKAAKPVLIIFKMVSYVPEIRLKSRFKELIVGGVFLKSDNFLIS